LASLLIIGGTGFFGKSILDSFKRGLLSEFNITKIIVLARNTEKFKLEFPELIFNEVELMNGDIASLNSLPEADFVIHAAASTNMNDYIDFSDNSGKNNIELPVTNYCSIAQKYHYKSKILYCSSGAVYGKQPLNIEKIEENFPFQQDLSTLPEEKKNYCLGKRFAETEIINLGKSGLSVSIARCFAFSGKYLPKDQHYALGNFIGQAENGGTVTVKTNGIVYRSYLEADELVKSLIKILQISSIDCPIYNVGSDVQISLYELAKSISSNFGVKCEFLNYNDKIIIDRYVPNINKLKQLMNIQTIK
jgi:nucleoside-diphosphate-sugar epimerase